MRGWTIVALCALPGCDILFQLRDVKRVDATAGEPGCGTPDEDGDCVADDVDNCPGIYNPSQANDGEGATHDMVGDVCDPQPTVPAETRGELWTFVDPGDATAWMPRFAGWTFEPGYVEHTDVTQLYALLVRTATVSDADLTIEAGFEFTAWSTTSTNGLLGVWIDVPDTGADGQVCSFNLYSSIGGTDSMALQERFGQGGTTRRQDIPSLVTGDQLVLSLRRRRSPDQLECHGLVNGVRYDVAGIAAIAAWPTSGHLAVSAGSASAKLRYVVTYVSK